MKTCMVILLLFMVAFATAQDPREFNHGSSIVKFKQNDTTKYYLTWSTSLQVSWEHDIYNSVICFDENGNLITLNPHKKYIGTGNDEAQEPVNAAYDPVNGNILTVWEDGTGNNAPDVRGQMHKPDGTILKNNWIIAGGTGSQHSANAAFLSNKFLVFYADEAPPSTGGAVVKCKVIDNLSGTETQTISLTPNDEDHWWPVSVSNNANTRTLVIWGNDGYAVRGTVLYDSNGTVIGAHEPQDYLINTQQYYYQAVWLENLSNFLIVARNGAYSDSTDESQIGLIDTLGNLVASKTIGGDIIREAKPTAIWSDCTHSYHLFYPTEINNLVHFEVTANSEINTSEQIFSTPDLSNIQWVSTGTWSLPVKDINDNNIWQGNHIILFTFNDVNSNDIVKVPVHINDTVLCLNLGMVSGNNNCEEVSIYPNPAGNRFFIYSSVFRNRQVDVKIYNSAGQLILSDKKTFDNDKTSVSIKGFTSGIYFVKLKSDTESFGKMIKLIKK